MISDRPPTLSEVVWDAYPLNGRVVAVILFREVADSSRLIIARALDDGLVYGARDVDLHAPGAAGVIEAWKREAVREGWPLIDLTGDLGPVH